MLNNKALIPRHSVFVCCCEMQSPNRMLLVICILSSTRKTLAMGEISYSSVMFKAFELNNSEEASYSVD